VAGARRVWAEILDRHRTANLRVYVVWFSMIPTDAKSRWRLTGHVIDDPRVHHFWDEEKVVGTWFARQAEWEEGDVMWDVFFLYGPDAEWGQSPGEPLAHGGTIEDQSAELVREVDALVGDGAPRPSS
jgi:hypothetical protein